MASLLLSEFYIGMQIRLFGFAWVNFSLSVVLVMKGSVYCLVLCIICVYLLIMDMFSLEEDDASNLFITQESKDYMEVEGRDEDCGDEIFVGVHPLNFGMPSKLLINPNMPHYSDISDDENAFERPKSV